jgi:hypothetical protein
MDGNFTYIASTAAGTDAEAVPADQLMGPGETAQVTARLHREEAESWLRLLAEVYRAISEEASSAVDQ